MPKFPGFAANNEPPAAQPGLSRRGFLAATGSAGLVLAFALPGQQVRGAEQARKAVAGASFEPSIWYQIDVDGTVTVNIAEAEMGQHVGTALARIVADELDADWASVRINHVDSDPRWGLMVTGGSWSVWQNFDPLSRAGAAGRQLLRKVGAQLLGVRAAACSTSNGRVEGPGNSSISYGEIVRRGNPGITLSAEQLAATPIRPAAQRRLIGSDTRALDVPGKTNGQAVYGIDAELPGMVHARPLLPPTRLGSRVTKVDDSAAAAVPGFRGTLVLDDPSDTVPGWVLVLGDSFHAANSAAEKVRVTWQAGDTAGVSEADLQHRADGLISNLATGALVVDSAGQDNESLAAAFDRAEVTLEARYTTATALHFQLEPVNALARQDPATGNYEIHTGNQWQSLILPVLATALQVPENQVVMRTYMIGGGFGRRLNGDYAVPAALACKALGRPVKMVLTREDDCRFDSPRSASVQQLRMALDGKQQVIAMEHSACAGWPTQVMVPSFMPKGSNGVHFDPFAISGADHWYSVGAHRVRAISNDLANATFRPGWLRSVGPGWTNWAVESFMDEAALAIKADPVAFRLRLLDAAGGNAGSAPNAVGGAKRQAAVLRRAAARAGWGQEMPAGTGLGVATTFGQERAMPTWCACVARVRVDRNSGLVVLEKLTLVIDAGTIVHPDGAMAQAEGAALWGASLALHEGTRFVNGQVQDRNLHSYTPMRMRDVPELDIELVASTEAAVGMGEPATTVVGPAIGNAIHAAVGLRLRDLPIRPQQVLAALQEQMSS